MQRTRGLATMGAMAAVGLAAGFCQCAMADEVLNTGTPDPGFFGYIGYDVFVGQSVGIAFTANANYTLDSIGVWMMSNDFDNPGRTFTLSLRTDAGSGGPSAPSNTVLESWNMATAAVGWQPVLDEATSSLHPTLTAGVTYWVVAESTEEGGYDPVWVWGSSWDPYYSANTDVASGQGWMGGYTTGSAPGTVVNATLAPTPSTLGVGMIGLAGLRRRRR